MDEKGKKGKKEAPKKGKGPADMTEELAYDEHGRALPRVFVDTASAEGLGTPPDGAEAAGMVLVRPFRRVSVVAPDDRAESTSVEVAPQSEETPASDAALIAALEMSPTAAEDENIYMSEIDPLMCATFELVQRFSATLAANAECPFLWRAIYPQLPDGRPCFNPAGRYCVKLFLAGAWRKVYVTDAVPVTESGEPAVASSSVPQELWPMLLSKAVYTAYTALGYHTLLDNLGLANAAPSATDKASAFVAFALSALTGWFPTAPMSIPAGTDEDRGSFLQDIAFGGCRCIALADKIRSKALSTAEVEVDESAYQGKLTKKIIRDLKETKAVKREHLKKVICKREIDIRATTEALQKVHSEFFCFVITNPEGTKFRVYPVLTIASENSASPFVDTHSPGSPTSTRLAATSESPHLSPVKLPRPAAAPESSQLNTVQLLVDWALIGPRPTGLQSAMTEESSKAANRAEDAIAPQEDEWTYSMELHQKWVPFSDFCNSMCPDGHAPFGVSVISFETRYRAAQCQKMHWNWASLIDSSAEPPGKGKAPSKGKDKKGAGSDTGLILTPLGAPVCGADQGVFPPTLLSIDISSLLKESTQKETDPSASLEGTEMTACISTVVEGGAEHAISPQLLVGEHAIGGIEKPDPAGYVAVVVHLQGEILASIGTASGAQPPIEGEAPLARPPMIADDVVLVLQEIRQDEDEPLVMRVALSSSSLITPITRTTFHIPTSRIIGSPNGGKLTFWVRLFTRASVMMTFACSCALSLGPAESIWQTSDEGVVALLEGESSAVRAGIEALILRVSFLGPHSPTAAESASTAVEESKQSDIITAEESRHAAIDSSEEQLAAPEESEPAVHPTVSLSSSCVAGNRVMVFLHVSDRRANRFISLLELSGGFPETCTALPRLCGIIAQLTPAATAAGKLPGQLAMGLVAKCFFTNGALNMKDFRWKLIILSRKDMPLTLRWSSLPAPTAGPTVPAAIKRFAGSYTPNNKLVLFRDQYVGVLNEVPIALRVSVLPFSYSDDSNRCTECDVWLRVRFINPNTRSVVREYKGRSVVPIYVLDLKQFLGADSDIAAAPIDTKKGKKDDKKGAKGGASDGNVSFIVECILDEELMQIPNNWRSRFPYTFSELVPLSLGGGSTAQPKFGTQGSVVEGGEFAKYMMPEGDMPPSTEGPQWVVDVIGGSVSSVSHDLYDLMRFRDIKNSWLDKSADRFDRASAALTYNAARLCPRGDEAMEEEIVGLLATALDASADILKPLEALLSDIPDCKEHVTVLEESQAPALVKPQAESEKNQLAKESADLDHDAQVSIHSLSRLNGLIREDVVRRMEQAILNVETHNGELREAWQSREKARLFLNNQNSSLNFLLGRVAEAKTKVFEPAEEDPKKKGKKK